MKRKPPPEQVTGGLLPIHIWQLRVRGRNEGRAYFPPYGVTLDWIAVAPYSYVTAVRVSIGSEDQVIGYLAYEWDDATNAYQLYHNPDDVQDGEWTPAPDLLTAITACWQYQPAEAVEPATAL